MKRSGITAIVAGLVLAASSCTVMAEEAQPAVQETATPVTMDLAGISQAIAGSASARAQATDAALSALGAAPASDQIAAALSKSAKDELQSMPAEMIQAESSGDTSYPVCASDAYLYGLRLQAEADPAGGDFWEAWTSGARVREEAVAALCSAKEPDAALGALADTALMQQTKTAVTGPSGEQLLPEAGNGSELYLAWFFQKYLAYQGKMEETSVDGDWGQSSMGILYGYEKENGLLPYLLPRWDAAAQLVKNGLTEDQFATLDVFAKEQSGTNGETGGLYSYAELQQYASGEKDASGAAVSEGMTEAETVAAEMAGAADSGEAAADTAMTEVQAAETVAEADAGAADTDAASDTVSETN